MNGIPGLFNAPVAIETYAKVFEEEGALDKLEAFASLNGPKHYRLPPNEERITLEKDLLDGARGGQGRGPGREGAGLPRRRNDRVEGGGQLKSPLVTASESGACTDATKARRACARSAAAAASPEPMLAVRSLDSGSRFARPRNDKAVMSRHNGEIGS